MREDIVKYRYELMGIASIVIILGHTVFYGQGYVNYGFLQNFFIFGFSGVDIFLFLSGFGLTFSIEKHSRDVFYRNRINRLMPTCIVIFFLYIVSHSLNFHLSTIVEPFKWLVVGGYWYIGFIAVCYFIFPYLFKMIGKGNKQAGIVLSLSIVLSLLLLHITSHSNNPQLLAVRNGIARIPIFITGIIFGTRKLLHFERWSIICFFTFFGLLLLRFVCIKSDYVYSDTLSYMGIYLLTIPIIRISGRCLNLIGGGYKWLKIIGLYSLELYLVQVTIMPVSMSVLNKQGLSPFINVIISIILVIFCAIIVKWTSTQVSNIIVKREK